MTGRFPSGYPNYPGYPSNIPGSYANPSFNSGQQTQPWQTHQPPAPQAGASRSVQQPARQRVLLGETFMLERSRLQQWYKQQRMAVRQSARQPAELDEGLRRAQQQYKANLQALQRRYGIQPSLMPAILTNCKNLEGNLTIDPKEFRILKKCWSLLDVTVHEGFKDVNVLKNNLPPNVEGMTYVLHPTFDDVHGTPYDEKAAEINLDESLDLNHAISVLAHEALEHLIPNMRRGEQGDLILTEEEAHFGNLNENSPYHQGMMRIKDNWPQVARLAQQLGCEVDLAEVMNHYLSDIGVQTTSYLASLGLDNDTVDDLTREYQEGNVDPARLSPQMAAGLRANLFYEKVKQMVEEIEAQQ